MKRVLVIMMALSLCASAFAQRKGGGYYHVYRPRVVVVPSIGFGVGYGYPFYGYPLYAYPYAFPYYGYPYGYQRTPSKLALQIQSINLDYKNRIKTVRHDKSLSRSERRNEIRNLKTEKEQAIIQAQRDFLNRRANTPNQNYSPSGADGSQAPATSNPNGNTDSTATAPAS